MDLINGTVGRCRDQGIVRKWTMGRGKAGRSRAVADARKGTRPAIMWHWLPGQGLGDGDLLGEREQVGPETFKRT